MQRAHCRCSRPDAPSDHAAAAELSRLTNSGAGALHFAADRGHVAVGRVLFAHGADPNLGSTRPLFYAVEKNHPEMVRLLIEHGAVVNPDKDWEPNTAMHLGFLRGNIRDVTGKLGKVGTTPASSSGAGRPASSGGW